jgi:CBS domain-containing protein
MKIQEIMSRDVRTVKPTDVIQRAAAIMAEIDAGSLPVAENDRLIGMVTDRDIVVRAVAKGKAPSECSVRDVMSKEIKYVYEDESAEDLARNMSEQQVRRFPVMSRDKRLVGIVALADLATASGREREAQDAITGVSEATAAR